jgi:Cysteine sulfinate desulfinase/cysteine desulfurase and related enzymes
MQSLYAHAKQAIPELVLAGEAVPRMGHVLNLTLPGVPSETQLMHLDLAGICVSAGSACASGRVAASHVLLAMGYGEAEASSAIRISAGWGTQASELEAFKKAWLAMAEKLSHKAASAPLTIPE